MKRIIIDHNDLDGIGCKIVLDYLNIQYDDMLNVNYGELEEKNLIPQILQFDEIVFTDFSPIKETLELFLNSGKKVIIIDHHDSSQWIKEINNSNLVCFHSLEKCGTSLTFDFYKKEKTRYPRTIQRFIHLVDTYDLYKTDHVDWEDAQNMNRILWGALSWRNEGIEKYTFIVDFWLTKIRKNSEWFWTKFEQEKINRAIEIENEEFNSAYATLRKYEDCKGIKYGVITCARKVSIVANRILTKETDIQYLIIINTYDKTWEKLSIRSKEEFNCNLIEGFEGHVHAAGGSCTAKYAYDLLRGIQKPNYKCLEV